MAQRYDEMRPDHIAFIEQQKLFFVGTAANDGTIFPTSQATLRLARRDWAFANSSSGYFCSASIRADRPRICAAMMASVERSVTTIVSVCSLTDVDTLGSASGLSGINSRS